MLAPRVGGEVRADQRAPLREAVGLAEVDRVRLERLPALPRPALPGRCLRAQTDPGQHGSDLSGRLLAGRSSGRIENAYVTKVVGTDRWRALFDVTLGGKTPIDLRCFLKLGDKTLSETWIYQYFP